jgi:aryl-alcohol dehydrogenase-like predicted oxidoreductase
MEELALSYCLFQKNIDNVIIGVDSEDHLNTNMNASSFKIEEDTIQKINNIKTKDLDLLNPSLW